MLKLSAIIAEAKILVPNEFTEPQQIPWLNAIDKDFFSIVKIPKIANFTTIANLGTYPLTADVRAKSVDKVQVGMTKYKSLHTDDVQPGQNHFWFDDVLGKITLSPAPFQKDIIGIARYFRISTTTFVATNLSAVPDAPPEYHWTFVPALCSKIALAQDDPVKAANYEAQYMSAWNTAAQEYAKAGA